MFLLPKFRSTPRPQQRIILALILVIAALILAACNDAQEDDTPTPTATVAEDAVTDDAVARDNPPTPDTNGLPAESEPSPATGEAGDAGESATVNAPRENAADPAPAVQTPPAQPQLAGEIVLWHSWAGAEGDALAQVLELFRSRYPGVSVQTLYVAHDDLLQSYAEAVLAESGPTLVLAPNWWLGEMVLLQLVTPIGPELAQATTDALFPAARASMNWQNRLYGLPIHVTTPSLYVNTQLYPDPPPASLDAWRELAASNPQHGIGLYANLYHLAWGLSAHDVTLFDDQNRVVLDQHPGAVDFLDWLVAVNSLDGSYVDQDYGMLLDRFQKGEFAFFVDGPWSYEQLNAALGGQMTVTPLPAGPAGSSAPWLYAEGLFLNPNTDDAQRRIAVTLAEIMASAPAAESLANLGGLLPANSQLTLPPEHPLAGFHAQAATAIAMPTHQEMDAVWGYGGDMILRALLNYPTLQDEERRAAFAELILETSTLINEANGR